MTRIRTQRRLEKLEKAARAVFQSFKTVTLPPDEDEACAVLAQAERERGPFEQIVAIRTFHPPPPGTPRWRDKAKQLASNRQGAPDIASGDNHADDETRDDPPARDEASDRCEAQHTSPPQHFEYLDGAGRRHVRDRPVPGASMAAVERALRRPL